MPVIKINVDDEVLKKLKTRADKNFLSVAELVEDIVRRSCVNYKSSTSKRVQVDDKLVDIFSREKRGRKKKVKKK